MPKLYPCLAYRDPAAAIEFLAQGTSGLSATIGERRE